MNHPSGRGSRLVDVDMTQTRLNLSLAPGGEGQREKANLEWLALKLGFKGGNISALVQHIARATDTSPVDFAAAMERAFAVATGIEDD